MLMLTGYLLFLTPVVVSFNTCVHNGINAEDYEL